MRRPRQREGAGRRHRWRGAAVVLLLALLFGLEAASVRQKSFTYDEPAHLRYGRQILDGDARRFDDSKMPVSALNALPGRIAAELEPGPVGRWLASRTAARCPTMLASLGLAILVYAWARRLYGAAAALLSLLLHVLDPNLLAHGRLATTDLYAAASIALALYAAWRFLTAQGRARLARGAAAAFAFGLAQAAKYTGVYLVPILLLVVAIRAVPRLVRRLRTRGREEATAQTVALAATSLGRFAGWAAAFALAALVVIHAAFLFEGTLLPLSDYRFRSQPFQQLQARTAGWQGLRVPLPQPYVEGLDWVLYRERTGDGYGNVYLLGETRRGRGFAGYFFVAGLVKVPLATQLAVVAALAAYLALRRRFRFRRDEVFLLVPAALFAVYFNLFFRAQIGFRYLLVVFPLLYVFAGCLLSEPVRDWARRRWGRRGRRVLAAAGAALGIWLAGSVLSFYPHFIPYVNELVVPRTRAYEILADSNLEWGQDLGVVERYLTAHPEVACQPSQPTAGRILAGTNWLTGVIEEHHDTWIRGRFRPSGHIGYSHLLFDVPAEEAEALRRSLGLPSPEPARTEPGGFRSYVPTCFPDYRPPPPQP